MRTKLEAHGIHDLTEYKRAVARQPGTSRAVKDRVMRSTQILSHDRGPHSPIGGLARPTPQPKRNK